MDQARVLTPDAIAAAITTALATIAPAAKLNGRDTRLLGAGAVIIAGVIGLAVALVLRPS